MDLLVFLLFLEIAQQDLLGMELDALPVLLQLVLEEQLWLMEIVCLPLLLLVLQEHGTDLLVFQQLQEHAQLEQQQVEHLVSD